MQIISVEQYAYRDRMVLNYIVHHLSVIMLIQEEQSIQKLEKMEDIQTSMSMSVHSTAIT